MTLQVWQIISGIVATLFAGGGLAAVLKTWTGRRKDAADADVTIIEGSKTVIASLQAEVTRLCEANDELNQELAKVQQEYWDLRKRTAEIEFRCSILERELNAVRPKSNPHPPEGSTPKEG